MKLLVSVVGDYSAGVVMDLLKANNVTYTIKLEQYGVHRFYTDYENTNYLCALIQKKFEQVLLDTLAS